MRRALTLAPWLFMGMGLLACGGRVELDGAPGSGVGGAAGSASSGGSDGAGGFAPHPECAAADGTRVCGGERCPWLEPPECLGYGCAPAVSRDALAPSDGGVCWAGLPNAGAELCYGCREGEVCIHRTPDQLICVPASVCEALWDLGVRDVCRYSDKTPYDHQPLPSVSSSECPGGGTKDSRICGGGCPPCVHADRCTGRSPTHPFGLCAGIDGSADPVSPIYSCSPDDKDPYRLCNDDQWSPAVGCTVFEGTGSSGVARRYGLCLLREECLHAAKYLPGGVSCYDGNGKKLTP